MRKAYFAETIFLGFTTAERAASLAGDLVEDQTVRFWPALLQAVMSLVLRECVTRPWRTAGLALAITFGSTVISALLLFSCFVAGTVLMLITGAPQTPVIDVALFLLAAFFLSTFGAACLTARIAARHVRHAMTGCLISMPLLWLLIQGALIFFYYALDVPRGNLRIQLQPGNFLWNIPMSYLPASPAILPAISAALMGLALLSSARSTDGGSIGQSDI